MNGHVISERVQQMRPSSFSDEERHRYQAEKMIMRQFMLMKHQDQVPAYLTVKDLKTWLLKGRNFLEEFDEIIEMTEARELLMAELAWTTARYFCLSQMEQELLEELEKEKRLSQQLNRKVTLEGLEMFLSGVRLRAKEDVESLLPPLFSKLQKTFASSNPLSAGEAKPAEFLQFERSAVLLVPEVVETALRFLLEEPASGSKSETASAEIGKLLAQSAASCLDGLRYFSKTLLLRICTVAARCMVKAVHKRFNDSSKSFQMMDYDESFFTARESVVLVINQMESAASSQTLHQLRTSEGPEEDTSPVRVQIGVALSLDSENKMDELQQDEVKDFVKDESVSFYSFMWNMVVSCFSGWT